jgi:hypothetical protein
MSQNDSLEKRGIEKSNCPKNGVCTFEVLKGKTFKIASKFGDTYPEFSNSTKTLLKFEYIRNTIPDVQDSSYRELVYVEIDSDMETLELENIDLTKAKVSFGRLCFCRGQTGYYSVKEGKLLISKIEDSLYRFVLDFKVNEVPQVVTRIEEHFSLE